MLPKRFRLAPNASLKSCCDFSGRNIVTVQNGRVNQNGLDSCWLLTLSDWTVAPPYGAALCDGGRI